MKYRKQSLEAPLLRLSPAPRGFSTNLLDPLSLLSWSLVQAIGKLFDRVDYFNCRAASLHSIPVSDVWRAKDTMTLSYYLVTDLQPCSEYEFKVQVLLLGMQPGPFSDTTKVKTTSVSKFFIFVHLISPHSRCQSQKK